MLYWVLAIILANVGFFGMTLLRAARSLNRDY